MEDVLLDRSPRSTLDISLSRSHKSSNSYSSLSSWSSSSSSFPSNSSTYSPYSSVFSLPYLLQNYNRLQNYNYKFDNTAIVSNPNGGWPQYQKPIISSYPSLSRVQQSQPPLLPLPIHNNHSFPSPCNKKKSTLSTSTQRRKPRLPRKETKVQTKTNNKKPLERAAPLPPPAAVADAIDDLEEEIKIKNCVRDIKDGFDRCSLSPPPSSLPLPGLSLIRPKTRSISCERKIYETIDNGATDDLRRILRL